ncbi:hypothetical protein D3C71_50630 [compost metagenome]
MLLFLFLSFRLLFISTLALSLWVQGLFLWLIKGLLLFLKKEGHMHSLKYVECVRFNELEIGDIFDYRTSVGTLYQVVAVSLNFVSYKRYGDYLDETVVSEFRSGVGVVGFYKKEVFVA